MVAKAIITAFILFNKLFDCYCL